MEEKIHLSDLTKIIDTMKEGSLRSKDYYKFVIGLSTGALVFSVTFVEKFSSAPVYKALIVIGWVCLIISVITGVWLLQKRDFLEAQWKAIIDVLSKPENIMFGIERDLGKLVTRSLASVFLKEETSKEPKDEEKIKKLKKEWLTPNGGKGKAYLKTMISILGEIYPPLATVTPDITRELEKWGQLLIKSGKMLYLPDMSKKLRETTVRVDLVDKVMRGFFFAGIILITLFSALNFLEIDVIGVIHRLFLRKA